MKRIAFLVCWLSLLTASAWAQSLEIITLRHNTAEQMLPQLQPLLEPGGTLSGTGDKLFLRTSPRNKADLLRVLEQLDRPRRRLMISVRQGGGRESDARGAELSGNVDLGRNVRIISPPGGAVTGGGTVEIRRGGEVVRGRVYETQRSGSENVIQQVQTMEGGRAFINVGQSVPVPMRQVMQTPRGPVVTDSVAWQEVGTGFYAEPRIAGGLVTIDISPSHDTPGALPGSANVQRLVTTVSGRLGEWIEVGGSVQESAGDAAGTARYSTRSGRDDRRVWLRVEELP